MEAKRVIERGAADPEEFAAKTGAVIQQTSLKAASRPAAGPLRYLGPAPVVEPPAEGKTENKLSSWWRVFQQKRHGTRCGG